MIVHGESRHGSARRANACHVRECVRRVSGCSVKMRKTPVIDGFAIGIVTLLIANALAQIRYLHQCNNMNQHFLKKQNLIET